VAEHLAFGAGGQAAELAVAGVGAGAGGHDHDRVAGGGGEPRRGGAEGDVLGEAHGAVLEAALGPHVDRLALAGAIDEQVDDADLALEGVGGRGRLLGGLRCLGRGAGAAVRDGGAAGGGLDLGLGALVLVVFLAATEQRQRTRHTQEFVHPTSVSRTGARRTAPARCSTLRQ
jgi:hypothetical protein